MNTKKQVGDVIKELRLKKGLTQRKLAEIVNVSNTTISFIEKNINKTSYDILYKIAKALDTTVEDIMKQVETEDTEKKEEQKQEEQDEQKEPSIEEIEDFLAGQKMLMFKGKPLTEDDLRSVYAFLQFLEKKYGDDSKK
ncbi:helix-turn-helix transcriptional regulator [Thermoanaerobacterium thermosaccharolyticum]|uniref:helix-turn-helix domain-containing protein n=1 Tax=Thermoanaerobacterium thermosaccharolyticum TaxID=1517 RepID=UPI002FDAA875